MRLIINDISFYARHGVLAEERRLGQEFLTSLELLIFPEPAGDSLEGALDYRAVLDKVKQVMCGPPRQLLETLALEIARQLLALPQVQAVTVRVCKPRPPVAEIRGGVCAEVHLDK